LPVLGNLLQINLQKLHSILEEWADNYCDIYQFKLFNKTVIAISEPALTQNILRDRPETFRRVSAIQADWMCFTADVTTNFAFGYDINLLEKKGDDSFQRHLEKFLPVISKLVILGNLFKTASCIIGWKNLDGHLVQKLAKIRR